MKRFCQKILSPLLVAILYSSGCIATTYTNKTFLMPRPVGVNLAMEYTTWHEMINKREDKQIGTNFMLTPFYQDSENHKAIGQYFGVNGKNKFTIANNADVDYNLIFHDNDNSYGDATKATVSIDPEQTVYGARVDYYQDLYFLIKNLYLKAHTSFVRVENDMNFKVFCPDGRFDTCNNLQKYFSGCYQTVDTLTDNLQTNLTHAKIGPQQSTTGFTDIDITLGYKVLNKKRYKVALNLGGTIPAGNRVTGEWLFEPVRGNGRHYAFGGGLDAEVTLWKKNCKRLKFLHVINYRYLTKSNEQRTLPLNLTTTWIPDYNAPEPTKERINFSQYYLLGKFSESTDQPLIPAANILTVPVEVVPGSQLESIMAFSYVHKKVIIDLGYNIFYKQAEALSLEKDPFEKNGYDVAFVAFETSEKFDSTNGVHQRSLTKCDLNFDAASTPSQFTHKVYGGIGYVNRKEKYNYMLGIGGGYEFATNNSELENWAMWAKAGMSW